MRIETAIKKAKSKLQKKQIVENFGKKEVEKLKNDFNYNPYGSNQERREADLIDEFDNWCMNYTGND